MPTYLARRLLSLLPVLLVVAVIVFLLIHITPGDPASFMLGPDATREQVDHLRQVMGLDQPLAAQFGRWFLRAVRGDLGDSIFLRMPVAEAVVDRLEPTLLLTTFALAIAVAIGVPLGVAAAARHGTLVDQGAMALALVGVSIPSFWLGLNLALLFGVLLPVLPVAGYAPLREAGPATFKWLLLPALSLGFIESALIARMTRSAMLEVLGQDYIRTARAKGLTERRVIYRHALRNALIPTITVIGNSFAVLMGGAVVTETVFNIPGMGQLIIKAVLRRDYPLIQGEVIFVALAYVLINLAVDMLYVAVDPRIKYV